MLKAIACHVRLRPPASLGSDGKINEESIQIEGNHISALNAQGDKRYHFEFEKCHNADSTQEEVFQNVLPLIEQAYKGINCTIFAYGVTGSGKTHTMQGTANSPGVIPRTVDALFQKRSQLRNSTLTLAFSYVEILKDEVYDLLASAGQSRKRDVRTGADGQNVVADLTVLPIKSRVQFSEVYEVAARSRTTASTKLNTNSSRSHAILTLYLEVESNHDPDMKVSGKICLTDLAGSENNNMTGNDRERMRESSAINTSLTTLGKVVDALNVQAQRGATSSSTFIPYRESKLTRLLQDALGGTSQSLMICCLAPGEKFARDTINTLQFGKKAKTVENRLPVTSADSRRSSLVHPHRDSEIHPRRISQIPLPQSRRLPHIPLPQAPTLNPPVLLSAQTGLGTSRPGRPLLGRPALSAIAPNATHAKALRRSTMAGNIEQAEKENVGSVSIEGQLDKKKPMVFADDQKTHSSRTEIPITQDLLEARPVVPAAEPATAVVNGTAFSTTTLTEEERQCRAKVYVGRARVAQQSGNLQQALQLYRKAWECVPDNQKIKTRITEIEMALEGIISPPKLSSTKYREEVKAKGGLKRSRAPAGSLAELTYDDDGNESPAKRGKRMAAS
ncbi:hypothetical protein CI109_100302 [Kwoniella shandongensis]|uniref:Uncharacterized protein n=1 Tax=Kwoniella shandongensis TaxID=1734106 RepID=A0A5M6C4L3_9TREE|nr:uncharacterized protein CI109_001853 [Kwoniella shandongensis]KAA5529913.1 hypothetical protein CI109_001853 [Kwoniella shandongensis]